MGSGFTHREGRLHLKSQQPETRKTALDDLQQVGGAPELGLVPTTVLLLGPVLRASVKAAAGIRAALSPLKSATSPINREKA